MNLNIKVLFNEMPEDKRLESFRSEDYWMEFLKIFKDNTLNPGHFFDGTMMVMKGAAIQNWYKGVGKRRKWVRNLDPNQAYAFGVDAFDMEVS